MSLSAEIASYTPFFALVRRAEGDFLLLYRPYVPFLENGAGYLELDAYYPASNALYRLGKTLEQKLAPFHAKIYSGDLRKLFRESNIGVMMKNGLLAIPPHGTRVCLNALVLRLPQGEGEEEREAPKGICTGCMRCMRACPAGALREGDIREERCLRSLLNHPRAGELIGLRGNVGGCDACQRACPFDPEPVETPRSLKELLRFDRFAKMLSEGKRGLEPLRDYLGSNYLRPYRLSMLYLNAAEAKGEKEAARLLFESPFEDIRAYARAIALT